MGLIFFFCPLFVPYWLLFGLTKALFVCNSALSNTVGGSGSSCVKNVGLYLATTILDIFILLFPYGSFTNYVYKTR